MSKKHGKNKELLAIFVMKQVDTNKISRENIWFKIMVKKILLPETCRSVSPYLRALGGIIGAVMLKKQGPIL